MKKISIVYTIKKSAYKVNDFGSEFYRGNWSYVWIDSCYEFE